MAKRKRLNPAQSGFLSGAGTDLSRPGALRAPIAQVASDTAAAAALEEVAGALRQAEREGRLIQALPLDVVVADHLIRDRAEIDAEAQTALEQSLLARGQQTPIEVMALAEGRFGLISGWRRLMALRQLQGRHGADRFGTVLALIRSPDTLADSYVAMVEENEIRADLSLYERARIVARALEVGVFETEKQALQSLFSATSYSRRSKIKSLLPVVAAVDGFLRFPGQMTERSGLALSKALVADPDLAARLCMMLKTVAAETAEAEARVLARAIAPPAPPVSGPSAPATQEPRKRAAAQEILPGLRLKVTQGRVELQGPRVDAALAERLRVWLMSELDNPENR